MRHDIVCDASPIVGDLDHCIVHLGVGLFLLQKVTVGRPEFMRFSAVCNGLDETRSSCARSSGIHLSAIFLTYE
jgi:hypothetical protein